ncbi:MAG: energy transducer TonB [Bacteroidota bacterium]|nr:energy transducer TonB [Bacteroidota bacterium]
MTQKAIIIIPFLLVSNEFVFSQTQNKLDNINPSKKNIKFETQYIDYRISNKIHLYTIEHKGKLDTFKIDTSFYENKGIQSISNHRYIYGEIVYDGIYRSYYPNGQKRLIIEMSINEIVAQKSYGYDGKDTADVKFLIYPSLLGDDEYFQEFIDDFLVYPKSAFENKIQGVVLVKFTVEIDGSVTNVHVLNTDNELLNKDALDVIKLTSGKWKPGLILGEIKSIASTIPIKFSIE